MGDLCFNLAARQMNLFIRLTMTIWQLDYLIEMNSLFCSPESLIIIWMTRKHLPFKVAIVCCQTWTCVATSVAVASCPLKMLVIPQYLSLDAHTHTHMCANTLQPLLAWMAMSRYCISVAFLGNMAPPLSTMSAGSTSQHLYPFIVSRKLEQKTTQSLVRRKQIGALSQEND